MRILSIRFCQDEVMSTAPAGAPQARALRKDAEENRQRLLTAARELFADRGMNVTLNDIAHHAGVGVGTAYRRFANKGEVMDALFEQQVAEISDLADQALADPDPWHGLTQYLEQVMARQARDRGLAHILSGDHARPEQFDWGKDVLAPKVNAIIDRAKQAGVLRDDIEGTDLVFIQLGLIAITARTRQAAPELYRRYLQISLDGLRAHPTGPSKLPTAALTVAQTHTVMGPTDTTSPKAADTDSTA
jgi:AcrR family transcriptional regulator